MEPAPRGGRAILLGELIGRDGIRYDVQLKGSGRTPYSRAGDGKDPLGPVLREYVVSEWMAAIGIPTSRSLAAVTTGEQVFRETGPAPGAVLTRAAQSHIRVGTVQYFADLQVETPALRPAQLRGTSGGESSAEIRVRVDRARSVQLRRFASRKIVCYAGLVPTTHESGERDAHGTITKKGSGELRAMLCEAGHHASRPNHPLNPYFRKLCAKRGYKMAVVALAHRLCRIL